MTALVTMIAQLWLGTDRPRAHVPRPAAIGKPAPRFVLERPSGGEFTLSSFAGRPLVVNVFASWCPPCRHELPLIERAYRQYRSRIAFVGVDEQEGASTALDFAKFMHVPYPIALDQGPFAASYGASQIPQTDFIDAHGIVRGVWRGPISGEELARQLGKLLSGKGA